MIKNTNLQNDLQDTFSVWSKVNDTDCATYPIVYNFFSYNMFTLFIRLDRFHRYCVCGHGLPDSYTRLPSSKRLYDVYYEDLDYDLAQKFYKGLVKKIINELCESC